MKHTASRHDHDVSETSADSVIVNRRESTCTVNVPGIWSAERSSSSNHRSRKALLPFPPFPPLPLPHFHSCRPCRPCFLIGTDCPSIEASLPSSLYDWSPRSVYSVCPPLGCPPPSTLQTTPRGSTVHSAAVQVYMWRQKEGYMWRHVEARGGTWRHVEVCGGGREKRRSSGTWR